MSSCQLRFSFLLCSVYFWSAFNLAKKCDYPLTEERKKEERSFSLMGGGMGSGVQGVFRSHGISEFSCFCCHRDQLWPYVPRLTHPSCVFWIVVAFKVVP